MIAVLGLGGACRDGVADRLEARTDTPALLRVIARSQAEHAPRRRTEADRRTAQERMADAASLRRRLARAASRPETAPDSSAGAIAVAEPASGTGPMRTIRIVPAWTTLRVGETAVLTLEALDSTGRRTHVTTARWRPAESGVVALDRTGAVTATAPGVTTIEAWVDTVRASAQVKVLPVVRGRVLTIDGEAATGVRVRFATASFVDSALVGPDGRFEFRPPGLFPETAELSIEPSAPAAAGVHPMLASLTARETGPELGVVLVPTRWTIRSGAYAGTTVDVSADAALRRWRGTPPFARSAAYRGRTRRVVGWPPDAFPLPVAFVREPGRPGISAADSVAFWDAVRRFEGQLGLSAFRPADTSAIGVGRFGVEVVVDPRIPPAAVTWASWGSSGDLNDARVAVRSTADFRNAPLIAHEMLHALGFGHAEEWRSVMTRVASPAVTALTAQDVAYVQLIHRVRAAQAAFDAELGFLEAAEGERRARR